MAQGLYELIGDGPITSEKIEDFLVKNPNLDSEIRKKLLIWKNEFKFWEEYSQVYKYTELGRHHRDLCNTMGKFIEPRPGEIWLDAGCGPGKMTKLILEKTNNLAKVFAADIILEPAMENLNDLVISGRVILKNVNFWESLPFSDSFFDGIVANLLIPYIIEFNGIKGKEGIVLALKDFFRILKPGKPLIWSSVKKNAHPELCFLYSIPDMIKERKISLFAVGMRIVRHAKELMRKTKNGTYTLLSPEEWDEILTKIGFVNSTWKYVFTHQAWVNRVYKPNIS